ncbi:reelin domain-containing protein 1 [Leptinotarsa decemlineata]|uniref:reelin domain-containing protein 1 n=1 Tax=Leptinotarsa decemlineata TaxID=7539 RepID=UPI003D3094A9
MYVIGVFVIFGLVIGVYSFPDGAPVDACVKPRPNQPYHGQARQQSPQTNPFQILQSAAEYGPGAQITVTIQGSANFKGFFIQARDVATNEWIGDWVETPNTKVHSECSAITHGDPRAKQSATLVWQAPQNSRGGQVYFTGTVLKEYAEFWSEMVSQLAA